MKRFIIIESELNEENDFSIDIVENFSTLHHASEYMNNLYKNAKENIECNEWITSPFDGKNFVVCDEDLPCRTSYQLAEIEYDNCSKNLLLIKANCECGTDFPIQVLCQSTSEETIKNEMEKIFLPTLFEYREEEDFEGNENLETSEKILLGDDIDNIDFYCYHNDNEITILDYLSSSYTTIQIKTI